MSRWMAGLLMLLALALSPGIALATATGEPVAFDSEAQRQQYETLTGELRCTVCQSETIQESNAELAADMRRRVYQITRDGMAAEAVVDVMGAGYGGYVRYGAALQANTALLWASPFLLFGGGLLVWWQVMRRRSRLDDEPEFTDQERAALERLRRGD